MKNIIGLICLVFILFSCNEGDKANIQDINKENIIWINNNVSENKNFIDIKWNEITHENFWNNRDFFSNSNYNFPDIKFSYPSGWEKKVAMDTDSFSAHSFYEKNNGNQINIKNIFISWCPEIFSRCEDKDNIIRTWEEKLELFMMYNKKDWEKFDKYYLEWLKKEVYMSSDKNRYIFEVNWDVIEFWFYFKNWEINIDFIKLALSKIFIDKK